MLTRDLDDDDAKLRTYVTTDSQGRFKYRATAYASRLYQFAWASHVNDVRFAASGYVTLLARASATLKSSPATTRVGRPIKLYGRLAGKLPRRNIDIVAQGRAGSQGQLAHVRRRLGRAQGPDPRQLPLPRPVLARAHLPVPDQDRARQRLRLLGRLLAHGEGEGPLMRRSMSVLVAVAAAALACAAPASAGTYTAYACNTAGTVFSNFTWSALNAGNIVVDRDCPTANTAIGVRVGVGKPVASGAVGGITFTSPVGTAITDFALDRKIDYDNPVVAKHHKLFTLYQLGGVVFAGAGDYNDTIRRSLNAQKRWYGYPSNEVHVPRATVTRRDFPALTAYKNDSRFLILRAGCFPRGGTPCQVGAGGHIDNVMAGAQITVNDFTAPSSVSVEAAGLLAGGARDGSDAVTVTAADNAGIGRVDIVDVTDPAAARVVGSENYDVGITYQTGEQRTDAGSTCSFRLAKPCPNLSRETVRPSSLQVGRRTLEVRVVDIGGNVVARGPYVVDVVTPSDRGAANGTNAKEPGRFVLRFSSTKKSRRTVSYGKKVAIRGRLLNADNEPIGGASVRLLTRDLRSGARPFDRRGIKTRSDGSFRVTVRARASRQLHFAWRARANDARFAANGYLTLRARAAGSLRARPKSVAVGRTLSLRGRLKGVRRGGVPIVLQGKVRGARRYTTFADATTSGRGTFRARYRFQTAAARGRTYVFRARIRRAPGFPYSTGYTRTVRVRVR